MGEDKLPVLADDVIEKRLKAELPGWWYEGTSIRRKYITDGWLNTLALVNTIGYVAEAAGHHPDLEVTWSTLWVKLSTHSAHGITERDFALARKIDATPPLATRARLSAGRHAERLGARGEPGQEGLSRRGGRCASPGHSGGSRLPILQGRWRSHQRVRFPARGFHDGVMR